MADKRKSTPEEFFNCCEGMDFAEMMRKMMDQRGEKLDSPCAEMMQKMRDKDSGCCDFDCADMMQKMTTIYCRPRQEKEETTE